MIKYLVAVVFLMLTVSCGVDGDVNQDCQNDPGNCQEVSESLSLNVDSGCYEVFELPQKCEIYNDLVCNNVTGCAKHVTGSFYIADYCLTNQLVSNYSDWSGCNVPDDFQMCD